MRVNHFLSHSIFSSFFSFFYLISREHFFIITIYMRHAIDARERLYVYATNCYQLFTKRVLCTQEIIFLFTSLFHKSTGKRKLFHARLKDPSHILSSRTSFMCIQSSARYVQKLLLIRFYVSTTLRPRERKRYMSALRLYS